MQHQQDRQQQRSPDTRAPAHERGYDADWTELRKWHITGNPFCVRCGRIGSEVDHIQPIDLRPDLRLDPDNLQTLCKRCHRRKTLSDKATLVKVPHHPLG